MTFRQLYHNEESVALPCEQPKFDSLWRLYGHIFNLLTLLDQLSLSSFQENK